MTTDDSLPSASPLAKTDTGSRPVQVQQTAVATLRVLDEVAHLQPIGVSHLAKHMGIPKSTVQRALRALEAAGWIRTNGSTTPGWVLTTKPIDLARYVAGESGLREAAREAMVQLREESGESVHLVIREGREVVVIDVEETSNQIRIHWPSGTRTPIHASSNGKALLSHLDEATVLELLDSRLQQFTDSTITDRAKILKQLEEIRALGYAVAKSEMRSDIDSIAAPILGRTGFAVASISVFAPAGRVSDVDATGRLVRAAANKISSRLTTR